MTDNKEKLIAELVNKGLDGDMDAVNACEDRIVRAKAKAMIVKVGKGTAERPPMPEAVTPATTLSSVSLDKFKEMLCFSGIDFEPTATIYNLLLYNNLGFAKLMPSFDLIDFYFINPLHF